MCVYTYSGTSCNYVVQLIIGLHARLVDDRGRNQCQQDGIVLTVADHIWSLVI